MLVDSLGMNVEGLNSRNRLCPEAQLAINSAQQYWFTQWGLYATDQPVDGPRYYNPNAGPLNAVYKKLSVFTPLRTAAEFPSLYL